jgi:hypothetical protein
MGDEADEMNPLERRGRGGLSRLTGRQGMFDVRFSDALNLILDFEQVGD